MVKLQVDSHLLVALGRRIKRVGSIDMELKTLQRFQLLLPKRNAFCFVECACQLVPEAETALQNVCHSFVGLVKGVTSWTHLFLLHIAKEATSLAVPPCKSSKAWQQNVSAVCLLLEAWQQNVFAVYLLLEADGDVCMPFCFFSQCASSFGI